MRLRVLFAVTHLLGAGHLTRAAALARAFAAIGHRVTLVSGGMPSSLIRLGGAELVQLPPVRTLGTDFRRLLDENGSPVPEDRLAARRALLVETLRAVRPDVLVTELFPFGRRVLSGEFLALIEAAHAARPRPLIACSIRDILATPGRQDRLREAHERLVLFYDLVLVHGDPALVSLDASWSVAESIRPLIHYTGYVDEGGGAPTPAQRRGIVVSGGSSAASLPLYHAAISAADLVGDQPWQVLVGKAVGTEAFERLRGSAPPHVTVDRARPDFRGRLAHAAVSVSQAGYNTVVDLLRAAPAAILVPFEGGGETEQRLRAERLASRGLASVVPEAELSGASLAAAVRAALMQPPLPHAVALDGAARSVELVERAMARAPAARRQWDWTPLDAAFRRARESDFAPQFWWRDDDAVEETPALRRLLGLAERYRSPVALAIIPRLAQASLSGATANSAWACALVHGLSHENHSVEVGKKAEFGPLRPVPVLSREAQTALLVAREAFGAELLPVFVPPWNRIAPALARLLPDLGYCGLSTFRDRDRLGVDGLIRINAHLDPVDWRGTRSLRSPESLIAEAAAAVHRRVEGSADRAEPIGLLTHHLVHDEPIWGFCEALMERVALHGVNFTAARRLFSGDNGTAVGL